MKSIVPSSVVTRRFSGCTKADRRAGAVRVLKGQTTVVTLAFVLIAAAAQAQQAVTINLTAATGVTTIPSGTGTFTGWVPGDPCISFGNIAFGGTGTGGQRGIYLATPGDPWKVVVNLRSLIPAAPARSWTFRLTRILAARTWRSSDWGRPTGKGSLNRGIMWGRSHTGSSPT